MDDQEIRSIVRDAIARHVRREAAALPRPDVPFDRHHVSHLLLPLPRGTDGDGGCLTEPSAHCTHCGFCQSFGH